MNQRAGLTMVSPLQKEEDGPSRTFHVKAKTHLIPFAQRCDGVRPVCTPCMKSNRGIECVYEEKKPPNRAQILQSKISRLEARLLELEPSFDDPPSASGSVSPSYSSASSSYSHISSTSEPRAYPTLLRNSSPRSDRSSLPDTPQPPRYATLDSSDVLMEEEQTRLQVYLSL